MMPLPFDYINSKLKELENRINAMEGKVGFYNATPIPHECSIGTIMCRETLTGLQLTITNRSDIGSRQINFCPFCGYKAKVQI